MGFLKCNPENDGILEASQIIPSLMKLLGMASDPKVQTSKTGRLWIIMETPCPYGWSLWS